MCSLLHHSLPHHDELLHHKHKKPELIGHAWTEPFKTVSQDKPFLFIVDLRYFVTVTEN
jgi:hypothetical protein